MQSEQFKKIMRLMRRTNEKVLVADESSDEVVVMMPLETYEDLLDGFEPCDCDCEKSGLDDGLDFDDEVAEGAELVEDPAEMVDELTELPEDVTTDIDVEKLEEKSEELAKKISEKVDISDWNTDDKTTTEETLSGIAEEEEEEKFYLEPV